MVQAVQQIAVLDLEGELPMNTEALERQFAKMGAQVRVRESDNRFRVPRTLSVDVRTRYENRKPVEAFEITLGANVELSVLNVDPADRHLVLMSKREVGSNRFERQRFLCGHDERHWFVAGIPDAANVTTVKQAKESLRPKDVNVQGLRAKDRTKRSNAAFKRQGEWFFVPAPDMQFDSKLILRNEPLLRGGRGGSKPHMPDELVRSGGTTVWVCGRQILSEESYQNLIANDAKAAKSPWRRMTRDADVFVRGKVRHSDHATIILDCWHRVRMNRESESSAMQSVVFLD